MKKLIIFMLSGMMILGWSGCMNQNEYKNTVQGMTDYVNQATAHSAERVLGELELKYGCSFEIKKVGGRIDTHSVTFYVSPKDNPGVVFKAVIDTLTQKVKDNCMERMIAVGFEKSLEGALEKRGVRGTAQASFAHKDDSAEDDILISQKEYFEKYQVDETLVYLALDAATTGESAAEELIDACRETGNSLNLLVAVNGVVLSDKYADCAKDMKGDPNVSATWFDAYSPSCHYHFAVTDGNSNVSEQELSKILAGD